MSYWKLGEMKKYVFQGESLRAQAKSLVIDFMSNHDDCQPTGTGLKQAEIFRECGLIKGSVPFTLDVMDDPFNCKVDIKIGFRN